MAARIAARYVARRLSTGGKVLSEEEKAAENVYIKKMEKEKLEKLAHKGPKPGEQTPGKQETPAGDVKPSTPPPGSSTAAGVSNDNIRNYAVLAGTVAAACGLGCFHPACTSLLQLYKAVSFSCRNNFRFCYNGGLALALLVMIQKIRTAAKRDMFVFPPSTATAAHEPTISLGSANPGEDWFPSLSMSF
ncbi:hypothetical protein OPV22_007693 [Ensete ventricosum]|uniref:ATPase family AAA domain-containing protein n=1 Tax=Ensete ventricosum TaxID=4639 RepID=A0AAV8RP22_ENSVE|nr:hypothetical protein OPV22_007693 [Ensete ventricosum]